MLCGHYGYAIPLGYVKIVEKREKISHYIGREQRTENN
jgi:hypothetical protein